MALFFGNLHGLRLTFSHDYLLADWHHQFSKFSLFVDDTAGLFKQSIIRDQIWSFKLCYLSGHYSSNAVHHQPQRDGGRRLFTPKPETVTENWVKEAPFVRNVLAYLEAYSHARISSDKTFLRF